MKQEQEKWEQIREYNYEASSEGKIRNKKTGRILKQRVSNHGYLLVDIQVDKKNKTFAAHRLIAEVFYGNKDTEDNKLQVDHINRNRTDNNVKNLRWITTRENMRNRVTCNITTKKIQEIIEFYKEGKNAHEIHYILTKD